MRDSIIKTEQKALSTNPSQRIYGSFAEVGKGKEVAVLATMGHLSTRSNCINQQMLDNVSDWEDSNSAFFTSIVKEQRLFDHAIQHDVA